MSATKPALARVVLVLAAVLVTLGLAELVVRLVVPPSASQVLRGLHRAAPDQPWLYEMVPGARRSDPSSGVVYAVNADGFRDRDHARVKPAGTFRIALIGDSVSFGYGVGLESTFARQLESRLATEGDAPRFEVLNLGVSGYNPYTEAELLRGVALGYAPDLVLVQFCINDLNDPTMHFDTQTRLALGGLPDDAFPDPTRRARDASSAGGEGIASRACAWSRLCQLATEALGAGPDQSTLVEALAPHENPSPAEIAWLERLYARMADETRARGGELVVVVFPWATQLAAGAPVALQEALAQLGARKGVQVIDLLPAFRRAAVAAPDEPLFLDLWHPTARGQQVAAEATLDALACAGRLPGLAARCAR